MLSISFALLFSLVVNSAAQELGYVAASGISDTEAQHFVIQAQTIIETIRNAWMEAVTFPQLALSFILASGTFPDRYTFERFTSGSKYWNPQNTIYEIEWVPNVTNGDRDGARPARAANPHHLLSHPSSPAACCARNTVTATTSAKC